jgi:hypothetical protein
MLPKTSTAIVELKPYTDKELSAYYGICTKTFTKWLIPFQKTIGERQGRYYNVRQVKVILTNLGVPGVIDSGS